MFLCVINYLPRTSRCVICGSFMSWDKDLFCSKECAKEEDLREGRKIEASWV